MLEVFTVKLSTGGQPREPAQTPAVAVNRPSVDVSSAKPDPVVVDDSGAQLSTAAAKVSAEPQEHLPPEMPWEDDFATAYEPPAPAQTAADTIEQASPQQSPALAPPPAAIPKPAPAPASGLQAVADNWPAFCSHFSGLLKSMLALCKVDCGEGVTIICGNAGSMYYLKDHKDEIAAGIANYFSLPSPNIVIISDESYNEPAGEDTFKEDIQSQINMQITFE